MKVSELGNEKDGYALLDYWVAKAEGNEWHKDENGNHIINGHYFFPEEYSTDWSQGGPIIERENICINAENGPNNEWEACAPPYEDGYFGTTALIAAMRARVASVYGDEFEI